MSNHRFLASAVSVAAVASIALPGVSQAAEFTDLTSSNGHYDDIMALVERGVITGFPDGTFQPQASLTRAQAAVMFTRALDLQVPDDANELLEAFNDIPGDAYYNDEVAALVASGISKGYGDYYAPEASLSREEMATLLVRAFDLQPIEGVNVSLSDLASVQDVHRENVEILYQNELTKGKGDGSYGPQDEVTRGQFSAFIVRGLENAGALEDLDIESVDDVTIHAGESLSLPETLEVTTVNGETTSVDVTWDLSNFDANVEGDYTIYGTLAGYNQKAEVDVTVENQPLQVEGVDMENLKQIIVELNHSGYSKAIVENVNYYTYEDKNGDKGELLDATAVEDQVILTLRDTFDDEGYLRIDEAIDGEEKEFELSFTDTTPPEVVEILPVSEDTIKVIFSEPMDTGVANGERVTNRDIEDSFDIDDESHRVSEIQSFSYGQELNVTFNKDLDEGDYTLNIGRGIKDYFGFVVDEDSFNFEMDYDTTDPVVTEIKDIYPTTATLVFDSDVELSSNAHNDFHHTKSSIDATDAIVKNGNEVVLTFAEDETLPEEGEIIIDANALEDHWGNENKSDTLDYTMVDNNEAPEIASVTMLEETDTTDRYVTLDVQFSEPVLKEHANEKSNYEITGDDGKTIEIKSISHQNQQVTIVLDARYGDFSPQDYTLYVDEIEDLFGETNDQLSYTFNAGSVAAPSAFKANVLTTDDDEVRFVVDFGREMQDTGANGIEQLNLYELRYQNTSILLHQLDELRGITVDINTYDQQTQAEIVIERDSASTGEWDRFFDDVQYVAEKGTLDDLSLLVGRVADKNGVQTVNFSNDITLSASNTFGAKEDNIRATELDELRIELSSIVYDFDDDDFIVYADENNNGSLDSNDTELDASFDYDEDDDRPYIYVYLDDELDSDMTYDGHRVYVTTVDRDDVNTTNRYGQTILLDHIRVIDGIASQVETSDGEEHVYVHELKGEEDKAVVSLEFTTDIDDRSVNYLSFTISNDRYSVEEASVNGDRVYLVVDLNGDTVEDLVGEYVEQRAPIADENENTIEDLELRINDVQGDLSENQL
ncbi:S-layer homology domain-containing protein [Aureibacillus halotolerans]|uniref:S-layer family protein n=1 Tax=Aureibacillus halotolerans TaxID=1508390 RepID=A0A4R6U3L9_9BACI|nr:S-layer homology domain-containing protein [Aureibacillus halotolerans]TDQ39089.1 S-layer family protein [Aureibacillus halotolerans]